MWRIGVVSVGLFDVEELVDATLMTATLEFGRQPHADDLLGHGRGHDPPAHREHVRIVVQSAHLGHPDVMTECSPDAVDFVGRDLFPLAAATHHDASFGVAGGNSTGNTSADRPVVDRLCRVGSVIGNLVAERTKVVDEMRFQLETCVVTSDGDAHGNRSFHTSSTLQTMTEHPVNLTPSGPPQTVIDPPPTEQAASLAAALALPPGQQRDAVSAVVARYPRYLDAWSQLGRLARDPIEAYAAFRVGYHRGLDTLRASGWRGSGYVLWEHDSNRGFLRSLLGLHLAAHAIGEEDEDERCAQFLYQCDPRGVPDDELPA